MQSLEIKQYRNLEQVSLDLSADMHLLVGPNAQGKTNLLESLYLLALGKSHRTRSHKELIRFGQPFATVNARIVKGSQVERIKVILTPQGKKIEKNGVEQKKLSQYIGTLPTVLFAPEDLALVKGSPQVRRRFLDMEIGQVSSSYLYNLTNYLRLLQQRNRLLKGAKPQLAILEVLDEQLIQLAIPILKKRLQFLALLRDWARKIHQMITNGREKLVIRYVSSFTDLEQVEEQNWQQMMQQELAKVRKQELQRKVTLLGPHRDDLRLESEGLDLGVFGSQGQQRTAALSLKLAEIELIYQELGVYPILLLDDVLSELDDARKTHLLEAIRGRVQTFVTTTSLDGIDPDLVAKAQIYQVFDGTILEQR